MKKLIAIVAGAAFAAALSLSFASPSMADPAGEAVVGGVLGFMAGAAAADSGAYVHVDNGYGGGWGRDHWDRGYRRYDRGGYDRGGYDRGGYAWRHHVRACFQQFGDRYDPRSDTVVGRYGDRRRCRL